MIQFTDPSAFQLALETLPTSDESAVMAARARQDELTKPAGSLGRLEEIALFMAGWQNTARPSLDRVQAVIFSGNHGVANEAVSAFPSEVTAQMVANFEAGGAAINALARACGATLSIVPLDLDRPTGNIAREPAMSAQECLAALNAGAASVRPGTQLLFTGEMGIANTTPAAALCAASFGGDAELWCGKGTGLDAQGVSRKVRVVRRALASHPPETLDAFTSLRALGGREIAAMAGAVLAARLMRIPVLLDGFIACAAIAPLVRAAPEVTDHCLAAHCSAEAGHARLLEHFGLNPLLRLDMRLGEGSGAALAVPLVRAALAAHNEMATFAEAAVAGRA